jgi:hypothetical protein
LNIDPSLSDPRAAHAGKVCLSAHLQREAAIEKMVPAVPIPTLPKLPKSPMKSRLSNVYRISEHARYNGKV